MVQNSGRLSTKIAAPVIRSLLVKRSRLVEQLRGGMARKLTLVVAPAGYGKTTVLGEWQAPLSKEGWKYSWLTLDQEDNDPLRFWEYVLDALKAVNPEWQLEPVKTRESLEGGNDHQSIISWINQIAAKPVHFSLILDDYHSIQVDAIHRDLYYLITHMPQQMHMVIASRIQPKFPLSELRMKNQLMEIDKEGLLFTIPESAIFLQEVMELDLTSEEIAVLAHTTEGWVGGLQMAALSIKNQPNASQWIAHFSGRQGYIFDYLTKEVLGIQDEPIQEFLLKTSILRELSASLCDDLLENSDSQQKLDFLESTNLFVTPLSEERTWYRYHALFADTLKILLEQKQPQAIPGLHLRAAAWLRANNFPEKAIPHAVSAGDFELASEIIEEIAWQVIKTLDFVTLRRWLNYLPERYLWRRPVFWIYLCIIETSLGNFNQVRDLLHKMRASLDNADEELLPAEDQAIFRRDISAIQAAMDLQSGEYAQGISMAMQAINELPGGDNYLYFGWLSHYLGYAYEEADELESAIASFARGCDFALKQKTLQGFIFSTCEIGRIRRNQGRLREAERELRRGLDYAAQVGLVDGYVQFIKLALGDVLIEQNRFEEAGDWAAETDAYFNQADIYQFMWLSTFQVYTYLTNYYLQLDLRSAKNYLQKARRVIHNRHPFSFIFSILTDLQVKIWLSEGDFSTAQRWIEKKRGIMGQEGMLDLAEQIGLARILLAQARPEIALSLLLKAEDHSRNTGRGERVLDVLILESLAYHHLGEIDKSLDALTQALALAEPEGYIRIFINEGTPLRMLLSAVLSRINRRSVQTSVMPSKLYIGKILSAFDHPLPLSRFGESHKFQKPAVISPMLDPLSERELEILTYLRDRNAPKEIAGQLMVSYHTIKTHIRNIYQKLDVHNRKEAIDRAEQLNLFD